MSLPGRKIAILRGCGGSMGHSAKNRHYAQSNRSRRGPTLLTPGQYKKRIKTAQKRARRKPSRKKIDALRTARAVKAMVAEKRVRTAEEEGIKTAKKQARILKKLGRPARY